ncbi:hypothetical protein SLS56_009887 [Neofusicoccum ribis]|uniref:Zn(2)-C6 fungal-type domain-containing protein n=1 Tax=Neofusicoccum ribis TaxID=45134 RepID=A0ABR3SG05_9PEZI
MEKKRTSKACVECRSRKIKCNGKRPSCEHCEQCQIPCIYAEGKREQNKRATERGDRLMQLLRDISQEVYLPAHLLRKVQAIESEIPDDDQSVLSVQTTASKRRRRLSATDRRRRSSSPGEPQGEADISANVGSEESVDLIAEDLNRTTKMRAVGFVGKNSEVAWAQRLAQAQTDGLKDKEQGHQKTYGKPGTSQDAMLDRMAAAKMRQTSEGKRENSIADFTYHLDMENVLTVDCVDKDELPPPHLAKQLLNSYMKTVGDTWPVLIKSEFLGQFQHYLRSKNPQGLPAMWRALLNMVFAIGAKFSHLTGADWEGDDRDHLVYYTRALSLGMPGDAIVAHPDIQRIQVLGLVSFYYLTISQVSRSWVMIGLACRQATALGLHLRNLDPSSSAISKEKRVRVWWSLYYLEYLLCEITGRPTAIDRRFCSTPMPAAMEETNIVNSPDAKKLEEWRKSQDASETPPSNSSKRTSVDATSTVNSANHFRCRIQLTVISQKVLVNLYSANTVTKSWERAQEEMGMLGEEIDEWYRSLPPQYQFTRSDSDEAFCRERVQLAFSYYSAKILVSRPCLCRVDKRIQKQGERSKTLDTNKARECIMAARSMSDLLPDMAVPDAVWIYANGPWWCIVHHLMQAMTVLMLELAYELCHMPNPAVDKEGILQIARKLLRWLTMMAARGNDGARSACKQARDQFKGFALFENIDTSDLVQMAEHGPDLLRQQIANESETVLKTRPNQLQESKNSSFGMEEEKVWPKAEQPTPTPGLEQAEDSLMHDAFRPQNIELTQEADLGVGSGFQQKSDQNWPQYATDQSWGSREWDASVNSTWNSTVFQTPFDISNPFSSFANSITPGTATADPNYSYEQNVVGTAPDAFAGSAASTDRAGTLGEAFGATVAEVEQPFQQTAHLDGQFYQHPPSSSQHAEHNHQYSFSDQQQYQQSSGYQPWPPYTEQ